MQWKIWKLNFNLDVERIVSLPCFMKYTVSKLYLLFGSRTRIPVLLLSVKRLRFKTKAYLSTPKNEAAVIQSQITYFPELLRRQETPWFSHNAKFSCNVFIFYYHYYFVFSNIYDLFVSQLMYFAMCYFSYWIKKIMMNWNSISLLAPWMYRLLPANIHCSFWEHFYKHNDNMSFQNGFLWDGLLFLPVVLYDLSVKNSGKLI